MQLFDALDLISNTFGDRLQASAAFEAPGNQTLRFALSIEGDSFRADFESNDGSRLSVTPGSIVALLSDGSLQVARTDTQSALDAWKGQPPITFAPVAAGLNQLSAGIPAVDAVIAQFAQLNGSLALGLIPDLCWYQATYATITLPGAVLEKVKGRVCLRDITFSDTVLSFEIELDATLDTCSLTLAPARQVTLGKSASEDVTLTLRASVLLNLAEGTVDGELIHLATTAPSGTVLFDGDSAVGFATTVQVLNLEFAGAAPTRGLIRAALQPRAGGGPISVTFAPGKQIVTNNVKLTSFSGASFSTLSLFINFQGLSLHPLAKLELRTGQVKLSTVGINLGGQPGMPDQSFDFQAPTGSTFLLGVDRLAFLLSEDGGTTIRIAACFDSPPNIVPSPPLAFGFSGGYQIQLTSVGQIRINSWNVGESDWRIAAGITGASGSLTGPGTGLPGSPPLNLTLSGFALRLISDEYAPCSASQLVVRRHAFGDFEIAISHFPKHIANAAWDGPKIPISPDAIDQFLSGLAGQISSGVLRTIVQGILGIIEAATSIAGFVDLDVYLKIDGSYEVDFDPANSTSDRLRFKVHIVVDLRLIIEVFGRLGICPFCIRVKIATVDRKVAQIDFRFDVDLFWEFDQTTNEIRVTDVTINGSGIVDAIGQAVLDEYKGQITSQRIELPQEFSIKKLRVDFPQAADPDVTIAVVVGVEKLDWT